MRKTKVWRRAMLAAAVQSALAVTALFPRGADGAAVTWIGGNNDWVDGTGNNANWNPADEPDLDDAAIFNTANVVNLGSNNSILALTLSGGIDLNTNAFDLGVNGLVQLSDVNTNLIVGDASSLLSADSVTVNNGANLVLDGGAIQIVEETGSGLLDLNAGGELTGHGTLTMGDGLAAVTTLIVNDGAITARRDSLLLFGAPEIGTLSLNASDADARIDLDGTGNLGVVNVTRNQTLDINIQLAEAFSGTMTLTQNATLDVSSAWGLDTGTINANNGFVDGVFPNPDVPAGTSFIAGGALTQSGGTINVVDTDGTLQFDAGFVMNGGAFNNEGHTIFNADATINAAATFTMGLSGSDLTVGASANVAINQASFNLDGGGSGTVITVNQNGTLNLNLGDYENDAVTNAFDGTITLNGGDIVVTSSDAEFVMDGVLNMASTAGNLAGWLGEPLDIGNDSGVLDADINVTGSSLAQVQFSAPVDFNSDADVNVAAGGILNFLTASTVNFDTVNGVNNAEFTGPGTIQFSGAVNVNEAVTLNMVGGTVDLDGTDAVGEFINIDAPLTINAATMSSFGKINGAGSNILDVNNSVGTGVLTVNLDSASAEWTLNAAGVLNLVNDNTEATLLAGSDVNLNGTVNVTGDVRATARVDIGSTAVVNVNTAAQPLRLAGGNEINDPNTIAGGTISGAGLLGADTGKALHGFGTISTGIDFDGTADLRADNGMLTVNGAILDADIVGTADADGILHVTNAWNTNVTTAVQLIGGTVSGGTITNDAVSGIIGHGLLAARVINNSQLSAGSGGTLIVQTAGNDNDWDGSTNTGEIEAIAGNIEVRDVGAAFGFTGTVRASSGFTAFASGFALDFNPGSTLALQGGGTYRSTNSTDLGGAVNVGAGGATIQVQTNAFLTFQSGSITTLGANLNLVNNNINVDAGATFSGAGAIVIPDGSHMVADNLANIGVLLHMQGAFRPGNSEGIGRIELLDYQNAATSELFVELAGTALNQFDRLVLSGDAVLDGYLNLDIDGGFVPALGNTFNIITGNTVSGEFDFADNSGMPPGLTFYVNYLPNAVQLQVVNTPFYSADFDDDGDVDPTDLAIWRGAFNLNQLGDANGDNRTDIDDWTLWRDQFGSVPGPMGSFIVPEPTSLALAAPALAVLALRRRRARRAIVASALLCAGGMTAVSTTATAAPAMSVTDNGLVGGDRQWLVQVAPDPALFSGGQGSLAVELGFEVTVGELLSASVNASAWPFNLPGNHSPFGGAIDGLTVNTVSDNVFAALGSNPFNNGSLVPVLTIVTQGAGETTLTWGGYNVPGLPGVIGARIAQAGTSYNGYQGSLTLGGASSDLWDNSSGSGSWSDATNWADDSEPGASQEAIFPVGFPNGDTTITLAAGETARQLTFHDSYTLSGGALTLSAADGILHVDAAKTATISSALTANGNLQLSGGGSAVVAHVRAAGTLNLLNGPMTVTPNGGNAGTSRVGSVEAAAERLDLTDNKLIVTAQAIGTWDGAAYTGVSGLIDAGRGNAGNALWDGDGIVSSDSRAINSNNLCSLGVATAGQLGRNSFGGISVLPTDVLVMFTYGGDANLDGKVNIDDYGRIDSNVNQSGSVFGWFNGDFNYDGKINIDDYGIIDGNISQQGAAFPTGADDGGMAAVPEPTGTAVAALAVLAGRRRRRSIRP